MDFFRLMTLPQRALRHLLLLKSYQRFYSADIRGNLYADGFDLSHAVKDGRYGVLTTLVRCYERQGPILDASCGEGLL
jgi:hypothetical protein